MRPGVEIGRWMPLAASCEALGRLCCPIRCLAWPMAAGAVCWRLSCLMDPDAINDGCEAGEVSRWVCLVMSNGATQSFVR